MKDFIDFIPLWYKLMLVFSVVLIVVSFIMPPSGVIDPSVLTAVGELIGFTAVGFIPSIVKGFREKKD